MWRYFEKKNAEAIIAADKTFIHFHERNLHTLIPSSEKYVGSTVKFNEKEGYTLIVTMDLLSSSLLRPFIISLEIWEEFNEIVAKLKE